MLVTAAPRAQPARVELEGQPLLRTPVATGVVCSASSTSIALRSPHVLIAAFLDLPVGQAPVSEEMKQELLQELR